ncbi:MAG TPA: asparagine synthase (glutamine-hydrolyzing) [Polyangiales bacterium]|nr:asparagine synthase (glutamine-hydrolyzing) [Polyangiales bacterium]
MCGLVAALLKRPSLERSRVVAALDSLQHRGPDERATWFSADRRAALGHVRLSIIGLANGQQPLADSTGDLRCVVNGEFYGYQAQREQLRAEGRKFATDSDSEVALHLYDKLGVDFVHELRGEFALVIADQRRRCLVAARDRFGIKPLFYTVYQGDVFLASEVKALLALGVKARWDGEAFFAELHNARPNQRSLFAGIHSVPPGCYLIARDGQVEIHRYWQLEYPRREVLAADTRSDAEVVAGFRSVLDDAVSQRLVADVEMASYLSGGIDSCAVLGLAQRRCERPIRAFTIAFGDELYNEELLARDTAAFVGANFVPIRVTQQQLAESFSDAIWHAETLVFNGHGVAKFRLSKAVRDASIKVVFTGEGADELLAGYAPFRRDLLLHNSEGQDPEEVRRMLARLDAANQSARGLLTVDGATGAGLDQLRARLGFVPSALEGFSALGAKLYPLLHPAFGEAGAHTSPYSGMLDALEVRNTLFGRDALNQSLSIWTRTMLPNYILTVLGDRMEMAHSVEGRVPFLDHHVAEYVAKVPVHHKIRGMREKHLLREATKDVILPEIYERQKHPFMSPPARDEHDAMTEFCRDVLASSVVDEQPFFEPRRVRGLMDAVADMAPVDRGAFEGALLRVVSTCLMQQHFGLSV